MTPKGDRISVGQLPPRRRTSIVPFSWTEPFTYADGLLSTANPNWIAYIDGSANIISNQALGFPPDNVANKNGVDAGPLLRNQNYEATMTVIFSSTNSEFSPIYLVTEMNVTEQLTCQLWIDGPTGEGAIETDTAVEPFALGFGINDDLPHTMRLTVTNRVAVARIDGNIVATLALNPWNPAFFYLGIEIWNQFASESIGVVDHLVVTGFQNP